ncbi:MAG: SDR family NAD(P)-dependent oxidoreductase, partial [Rhodococcus sp. (in: high G+C Gram-positive bacteria)]
MTEQQFQRALNLDEQIVLITGGARGLGAALSRAFSRSGARVIVNYNKSRDAAQALVTELGEDRAYAVQADVTDRSSVDQLF